MSDRAIECADGSRWQVTAAGRPSPYRIDVVFESVSAPELVFRAEIQAARLDELSDEELCFVVNEARSG